MAGLLALICFSGPVVVSKVSREANAFTWGPYLVMAEMQYLELAF